MCTGDYNTITSQDILQDNTCINNEALLWHNFPIIIKDLKNKIQGPYIKHLILCGYGGLSTTISTEI